MMWNIINYATCSDIHYLSTQPFYADANCPQFHQLTSVSFDN